MRLILIVRRSFFLFAFGFASGACKSPNSNSDLEATQSLDPCPGRFQGKLPPALMGQFGQEHSKRFQTTPWVDWQALAGSNGKKEPSALMQTVLQRVENYDGLFKNLITGLTGRIANGDAAARGELGSLLTLLSLEQQRIDLVRCNLWDTNGTIDTMKVRTNFNQDQAWPSLQKEGLKCEGDAKRFRTYDGTCNDLRNPLMGSVDIRFPRNVSFAATKQPFPIHDPNPLTISRELLARKSSDLSKYRKAPFFNLLGSTWIQWMTHDWFAHSRKGRNDESRPLEVGGVKVPATLADPSPNNPPVSSNPGQRPGKGTFRNTTTFWWDGSQIYGWDPATSERVRRKDNRALLLLRPDGTLPTFSEIYGDMTPEKLKSLELSPHEWNQEVTAFTENWWAGLSLLTTAFAREHNRFVAGLATEHFRKTLETLSPREQEEAYQYGRLYISALIAKIHTIEWTTQLLFNPVLDVAMHANWMGIAGHRFGGDGKDVTRFNALAQRAIDVFRGDKDSKSPFQNNALFNIGVAAPGIPGSTTNHFGSPFGLPEEFTQVYRLHPLLPDQVEFRQLSGLLSGSQGEFAFSPVAMTQLTSEHSPQQIKGSNMGSWWASFGTQRSGLLVLDNYPHFLRSLEIKQNPDWARSSSTAKPREMDLAALEIIRDRERGIPRFNEFRRQIGLKPLTDFDDFIDQETAWRVFKQCDGKVYQEYSEFKPRLNLGELEKIRCEGSGSAFAGDLTELKYQVNQRDRLLKVYGTAGIEKVDTLVGIFAENTRPHGFALSETQFQVFILNASRRLFSDRFLSTDYNPNTYTTYGFKSLQTRGMKEVLADNFPELRPMLSKVENTFDPWTRPRKGYDLSWGFDSKNFQKAQ